MNFKLIMPMAGNGSRFVDAGYKSPKPLIDVLGKPMFVCAVENIGLEFDEMIFIVRKEHNIKENVKEHYPQAHVVELDSLSEGAACSVLAANTFVNDDDSIFITNCDQFIEWDSGSFNSHKDNDGIILTFDCPDHNPKWSYARTENDYVVEVAEKNPISDYATSGHYYWKNWSTFKTSALKMIENNERVNGEFYLAPVYNQTIASGGKVKRLSIDKMYGVGTPEDLDAWLSL
jgi:dTDP-glucose pyrophosphorylase